MGLYIPTNIETVILTGIYGSGKSTLADKIITQDSRTLISLDSEICYGTAGSIVSADVIEQKDRLLYNKLTNGSRVLLDGLPIYDSFYPYTDRPVDFILGTREKFLDYLKAFPNTKIFVLVCNLETWLLQRLPTKSLEIKNLSDNGVWTSQHPEWVERIEHYRGFYGNTLPWLIEHASQNVQLYCTDRPLC